MIFCVLLNPTIDQIISIPNFSLGGTYKISEQHRFPVGKSISVALTLSILQVPVQVIAFIGKAQIEEYSTFLASYHIKNTLIPVEGHTRSNITIVDPTINQSSHLRFPGFSITREDLTSLHAELSDQISADDYVIYSGSLPLGCPVEYYFTACEIVHRKRAHIIIDTNGDPLINMLLYHPFMIKANLEEMAVILGKKLVTSQELSHSPNTEELYQFYEKCHELVNTDTKINILTLAQYGSLAFNREQLYYAVLNLEYAPYTVGCGDAFLGGYLAGINQKMDFEACLRLATAAGAANTQTMGAGILVKAHVDEYFQKVKII